MTKLSSLLLLASALAVASSGPAFSSPGSTVEFRSPSIAQGSWKIPDRTVDNAAKRANAASGRNVTYTLRSSDTTKVLIRQALPGDGAGTALAGTFPVGDMIFICPDNIRKAVPQTANNSQIMEDVLTLILLHEFEHLDDDDGGDDIPGTNPDGSEPCGHLGGYKRSGESTCAAAKAILDDPNLSAEEKCHRIMAHCKYLEYLQGFNTPANVGAAANCQPPVPTPNGKLVQDCIHCPPPGTECPVHGTSYQSE